MSLPSSAISLDTMNKFFGRLRPSAGIRLSHFYGNATGVASSGVISMDSFRGKSFVGNIALPNRTFFLVYQDGSTVVKNNGNNVTLTTGANSTFVPFIDTPSLALYPNTCVIRCNNYSDGQQCIRHTGFVLFYNAFVSNDIDFLWRPEKFGDSLKFYNYFGGGYYLGWNSDQLIIKQPDSGEFWYVRIP